VRGWVGGGHGSFESAREHVDLRPTPQASGSHGNLLCSPSSLHLFIVREPLNVFLT
jgi:hypothetical protein